MIVYNYLYTHNCRCVANTDAADSLRNSLFLFIIKLHTARKFTELEHAAVLIGYQGWFGHGQEPVGEADMYLT
jgi:hypothetical protein